MESDLERDRATIVALNTALTNTNTALTTATTALANAWGPVPPSGERPPKQQSIPTPHEYDGSQDQLPPFISQLRTKFLRDAHKFVDVQHRLTYAIGFLKGKAYEQILLLIDCNMCTCSGNGTQEQAVQDLLSLVDLYLIYLI